MWHDHVGESLPYLIYELLALQMAAAFHVYLTFNTEASDVKADELLCLLDDHDRAFEDRIYYI